MRKSESKDFSNKQATSVKNLHAWRGGGLADILNDDDDEVRFTGVQFQQFDFDLHVESQPKYHAIVHKLTQEIEQPNKSDSRAKLSSLKQYLELHPECVLVDPVDSVGQVVSRAQTFRCLQSIWKTHFHDLRHPPHRQEQHQSKGYETQFHNSNKFYNSNTDETNPLANATSSPSSSSACPFSLPRFVVAERVEDIWGLMQSADMRFPVICKPVEACATARSHAMVVVLRREGLVHAPVPCVVQQYLDHGGVFYKVYVVGGDVRVFRRPSLPDLDSLLMLARGNGNDCHPHEHPSDELGHGLPCGCGVHGEGGGGDSRGVHGYPVPVPVPVRAANGMVRTQNTYSSNSHSHSNNHTTENSYSSSNGGERGPKIRSSVPFDTRLAYPVHKDFLEATEDGMDGGGGGGVCSVTDNGHADTSGAAEQPYVQTDVESASLRAACNGSEEESNGVHTAQLPSDCPISMDRFRTAASAIGGAFGLTLFGFDVIVPRRRPATSTKSIPDTTVVSCPSPADHCTTSSRVQEEAVWRETGPSTSRDVSMGGMEEEGEGELVVIDVNFFPSYKEITDFPLLFRAFLRTRSGLPPWVREEHRGLNC